MKTFIRTQGNYEDVFKIGIDNGGSAPFVVTKYKPWNERVCVRYAQTKDLITAHQLIASIARKKEEEGYFESRYLQPFPYEDPSTTILPPVYTGDEDKLVLVAMRNKRGESGFIATDERGTISLFLRNDVAVRNTTQLLPRLVSQVKELSIPPQSLYIVDFLAKSKSQKTTLMQLFTLSKERAKAILDTDLRINIILQYPHMSHGKLADSNPLNWMNALLDDFCAVCKNNPTIHCPLTFTSKVSEAREYLEKRGADGYLYQI